MEILEEANNLAIRRGEEGSLEQVRILYELGKTYKQAGDSEKGKRILEDAFVKSVKVLGESDPQTIRIYAELRGN